MVLDGTWNVAGLENIVFLELWQLWLAMARSTVVGSEFQVGSWKNLVLEHVSLELLNLEVCPFVIRYMKVISFLF